MDAGSTPAASIKNYKKFDKLKKICYNIYRKLKRKVMMIMKKYAIYAYDNTYGGLHGCNAFAIVDCRDQEEAEITGAEMSREVIDDFGLIDNEMEEYINSEDYNEEDSYDYENALIEEDVAYEIYEVIDTKGVSDEILEIEFWNDKENFVKEYCKQVF
jgi:hypothetical protein